MAAGEGKRMNSSVPKILHKFNSIPMLIRIIIESYKLVPNKIIIITGKYDKLIKDTIDQYFHEEELDILKCITYVKQLLPNGTGDAIKSTLEYYNDTDNVLILNGDMPLVSHNLLQKFVFSYSQIAKLLVAKLDNPYGYGRILYDNNGDFIGIKEEKDCIEEEKKIDITNVGIYYFNAQILKKYIPLIDNNNSQKEYYLTDIIKIIKTYSDIKIETYQIEENLKYQIMGVNTQEELKNLEYEYKLNILYFSM
jgi:bifunctional N-acetylglucosamine-1-phosphate-uridyltransferase/glucosamine-1-phosphate-acetyltransferase GlmU-like protein